MEFNENPIPIDPNALRPQCKACKVFILTKQMDKSKPFRTFFPKRKTIKIERNIKILEKEKESHANRQSFNFQIVLEQWMGSDYAVQHGKITKLLILAALVPPSTAEVERSFSLMKLICTKLRKRLLNEDLSAPMRICKYTREINYEEIMELWLKAEETSTKKRHIGCRLR